MFKLDHKILNITTVIALSSTILYASPASLGIYKIKNTTNIDGGVTYDRSRGVDTAYRYNQQDIKGINHGRIPTNNEIKAWDKDLMPDGTGFPDGEGSVEDGDELYEAQCASCHGEFGAGGKGYPQLTGGNQDKDENGIVKTLKNQRLQPGMDAPKRTVGTYWPKVSTLWWYIRDAMPYAHPKSLTDDEVYAITAYILANNNIEIDGVEMDDEYVLNREKLIKVVLPNANGFYPNIDGENGIENVREFFSDRAKNIGAGTRCMRNCKDPGMDGKTEASVMRIKYEIDNVVPAYSIIRDLPVEKDNGTISKSEKLYNQSCKLCHATDTMGAPAVGDSDAWNDVMSKGLKKVVANAIYGVGGMPPKGGNGELSNTQIKQIVEFMVNSSKEKH